MNSCHNQQSEQNMPVAQEKSFSLTQLGLKGQIIIFCLIGVIAIIIATYVFRIPLSRVLTIGFLLLCPLSHLFLMKNHKH